MSRHRHAMPFGALITPEGVRFRLWAPASDRVELILDDGALELSQIGDGFWELTTDRATAGTTYMYRADGGLEVPDPASRMQVDDVHGPSVVVDPEAFEWHDDDWRGRRWEEAVLYELHVGAFSPEGTFAGVEARLDHLVDLGVTAVELMPVADFPGARGWGYDGVLPFAPDRVYGAPDDLKALVHAAHDRGLMVLLDVVYNHFGPEGNYLHLYAPQFFTDRYTTPWGAAVDLSLRPVRDFFLHNALYWLSEYRFDGLRLDAVHAIHDEGPVHVVDEIAHAVREGPGTERRVHLVLENDDNAARFLPRGADGLPVAATAQWNDDIHHVLHVLTTGETDGYYTDFAEDPARVLLRCLTEGFVFQGDPSPYRGGEPRGEPSGHLPPAAFVSFAQNHDQVGNRAFGERLGELAPEEAVRAVETVLLLAPSPPLLFMGEEWGATTPFLYFCDVGPDLAAAVEEGRRQEFARFPRFSDPETRARIPSPIAEDTFLRSRLRWEERDRETHRAHLDRTRRLLALRRELAKGGFPATDPTGEVVGETAVRVTWRLADGGGLVLLANLGGGEVDGIEPPSRAPLVTSDERVGGVLGQGRLPAWGVAWFRVPPGETQEPEPEGPVPRATYRLQMTSDFTLGDAAELVPYLAELGASHLYLSPILQARSGSRHGYDIVDHGAISSELGGEEALDALSSRLDEHSMGLILDLVPNHMGVMGADNDWWLDLLENGAAAEHAETFDVQWRPVKRELEDKVLVPVLGASYGDVLDAGDLKLTFDPDAGRFAVRYYEHLFPVDPATCPTLLRLALARLEARLPASDVLLPELESLADAFEALPRRTERDPEAVLRRRRDSAVHRRRLSQLCAESEEVAAAVRSAVAEHNRDARGRLHPLCEAQGWRLAHWKTAADEINYRRFFDINDLAGLRAERPEVFAATHRLVLELVAEGRVDGLRIDHVDGLADPAGYLERLRAATHRPVYTVVEKILAPHERLRETWPVAGTTGYDFAAHVGGLLVDVDAEHPLDRVWRRFIGRRLDPDRVLVEAKLRIMDHRLSSELLMLATELNRISESDPATRDYTLASLRRALREVVAAFPVYRTYVADDGPGEEDRRFVDWAVSRARGRMVAAEPSVLEFVRRVLLLELTTVDTSVQLDFVRRFEQYTGPVMAKGLEDTTFYIYHRLACLNEVGSEPHRFGVSPAAFHHLCRERLRRWPHAMLATATHDTKRSEDVRARIAVLSEVPDEWASRLARWSRVNRRRTRTVDGEQAPSRNDRYLLYQTLVGSWPRPAPVEEELAAYRDRITAYMVKAAREASIHTSWLNPDPAYEDALAGFVVAILDEGGRFLPELESFVARVERPGIVNALSQLLLRLTAPGVPDTYQGTELWDLSLVDPDNRRPVDWDRRRRLLGELGRLDAMADERRAAVADLLRSWPDGRVKMHVLRCALGLRKRCPGLFRDGDYEPLEATGEQAQRVVAFARRAEGDEILVVVSRLTAPLCGDGFPLGAVWADTAVDQPPGSATWRDELTGREHRTADGLALAEVFADLPVALLVRR